MRTDADKRGVNVDGMLASLNDGCAGTIIVLHACCHNPTGYDITPAQWDQVIAVIKARLTPFLTWRQGFGTRHCGRWIRSLVTLVELFRFHQLLQSFSLAASASAACPSCKADKDEARVSQVIRTNHPTRPRSTVYVVAAVL